MSAKPTAPYANVLQNTFCIKRVYMLLEMLNTAFRAMKRWSNLPLA